MTLFRWITFFVVGIITSLYYFPLTRIVVNLGTNSKLILALIGLVILGYNLARNRGARTNRNFLILSAFALAFSLICYISTVINNTPDNTYSSYFISMWVWLSGAYTVVTLIRCVHGKASIELVSNYIIGVCVAQSLIALGADMSPAIKNFVDWIQGPQEWIDDIKRLYGLGATLDTAGIRFSIAEVLLAYMLTRLDDSRWRKWIPVYIISFIIIAVIGNMMARTTSVGTILALIYIAAFSKRSHRLFVQKKRILWKWGLTVILLAIPVGTYLYNTNNEFHDNLRFGFEGVFNLVETGVWKVGSNETLKGMIVWPETLHTWIIGDGYFVNPVGLDPYYTGPATGGYYMDTDIGYLRFIFYSGLLGLTAFSLFICVAGKLCADKFPRQKALIWFLVALNFICWLKVATDIFLIFALLMSIGIKENEEFEDYLYFRQ